MTNLLNKNKVANKVGQGVWRMEVATGQLDWCGCVNDIYGVPRDEQPNVEEAIGFFKAGWNRDKVTSLFNILLVTGEPYRQKLTIVTRQGEEVYVTVTGEAVREDGKTIVAHGTIKRNNEFETDLKNRIERRIAIQEAAIRKVRGY